MRMRLLPRLTRSQIPVVRHPVDKQSERRVACQSAVDSRTSERGGVSREDPNESMRLWEYIGVNQIFEIDQVPDGEFVFCAFD